MYCDTTGVITTRHVKVTAAAAAAAAGTNKLLEITTEISRKEQSRTDQKRI